MGYHWNNLDGLMGRQITLLTDFGIHHTFVAFVFLWQVFERLRLLWAPGYGQGERREAQEFEKESKQLCRRRHWLPLLLKQVQQGLKWEKEATRIFDPLISSVKKGQVWRTKEPGLTWKSILVFVPTGGGRFSNLNISKVVWDINKLLSYYDNLVFWASYEKD